MYRKESLKGCSNPRVFEFELDTLFKDMFNKLLKRKNYIFDEIVSVCENYLESHNNDSGIKNIEFKILLLNNKKDKLLELVMEEYLEKADYKKQVDLLNEEISSYQNKLNELKIDKKDKNYIKNKINEIKKALDNCLTDDKCYSGVFNELIDKIIVNKIEDKKIKLDIYMKTGESIYTTSDNLGRKFHLLESDTPCGLLNDTFTITRGLTSKYTKKYDVEYEYNCYTYF